MVYRVENSSESQVSGLTRRNALKVGAVAGVGLLSMPLPASAIASSGASGEGGGGAPTVTGNWTLTNLGVFDESDGLTSVQVQVDYDALGLSTPQSWFVRWFRDTGEGLDEIGNGSGTAYNISGSFSANNSANAVIQFAYYSFVGGATYVARLYVGPSPQDAPIEGHHIQVAGVF